LLYAIGSDAHRESQRNRASEIYGRPFFMGIGCERCVEAPSGDPEQLAQRFCVRGLVVIGSTDSGKGEAALEECFKQAGKPVYTL